MAGARARIKLKDGWSQGQNWAVNVSFVPNLLDSSTVDSVDSAAEREWSIVQILSCLT